MKTFRFIAVILLAVIVSSLFSLGASAADIDYNEQNSLIFDSEADLISIDEADINKRESLSVVVKKGGTLHMYLNPDCYVYLKSLIVEEGATVIVEKGAKVNFLGESSIAGTVIISESPDIFSGFEYSETKTHLRLSNTVIEKTGVIKNYGELRFTGTASVNNGYMWMYNNSFTTFFFCKDFSNLGRMYWGHYCYIDFDERTDSLHGNNYIPFNGSVFAESAISGYVLTGVFAFLLGAALVLVIHAVKRKTAKL